ncbi:MAG: DNA topoisomerase IV subunit A, partial [Desulfatitalea sp.]|nr:DNA topoisomerase IV subunit A [Desulfatitalea sp.]NNJ99053.1 DNA topoisomerase IV subunit A [Desulfatitalea sp.]
VDAAELNYKAGDEYLAAAAGKSNQPAVFLDSSGRSYMTAAAEFPTVRSNGIPLTGLFKTPAGVHFVAVLLGEAEQKMLVAGDSGYGFITQLQHMYTRNQKGKAFLTVSSSAVPLPPQVIPPSELPQSIVAITQQGRMLVFPLEELVELPKGKGNKVIHMAPKDIKAGTDRLLFIRLITAADKLVIQAGKRSFTLTAGNVKEFTGARGRRGKKLPRGFQRVTAAVIES